MMSARRPPPPGAYHPPPDKPGALARSVDQPPLVRSASEWESELVEVTLDSTIAGAETVLYRTKRAWRDIDVYVDASALVSDPTSVLIIAVYAVAKGMRSLVQTGRLLLSPTKPVRMVSLRGSALCDQWEVSVINAKRTGLGFVHAGALKVAIVATDGAAQAPDDGDGVIPISITGGMSALANFILFSDNSTFMPRLVGINAMAAVAGRFLHIHNTNVVAGVAPAFGFGIPSIGSTVIGEDYLLSQRRYMQTPPFITIVASTTCNVTTGAAIGDVTMQGWVR